VSSIPHRKGALLNECPDQIKKDRQRPKAAAGKKEKRERKVVREILLPV
jgi:hypothetical protein